MTLALQVGILGSAMAAVPSGDITLQKPIQGELPIISPLCGYEVGESAVGSGSDAPVFAPYNAGSDAWWDNLVAELLQARITNVSFATRGATIEPGVLAGSMNPRRLKSFVDATTRAGVSSMFKVACFVDAPAAKNTYNWFYGFDGSVAQNMADNSPGVTNHWQEIWWLRFVKPWFDTVPQSMWFLENGKPRIEFWGLNHATTNREGNCSGMISYLGSQMQATYGVTPNFFVWSSDTTLESNPLVVGSNPWFSPPNKPFQFKTGPTGYTAGTVIAGYSVPSYYLYMSRDKLGGTGANGSGVNGDTLRGALDQAFAADCHFNVLEGWTNILENMGVYRCAVSPTGSWDTPNQYINILRPYTDLRTVTIRLEAEGCDQFVDNSPGNSGGTFLREGDLDVRGLVGTPALSGKTFLPGYPVSWAMDNNYDLRWTANGPMPQWLQYDYGSGRSCAVNTYYLSSANNHPERDPKSWQFQASNDGTTWTTLDTRSDIVFESRKQTKTFQFTNSAPYRFYRLNITAAQSATINTQVGELRITGGTVTGGGWVVTNTEAGEWIDFDRVHFSDGYYKFPIRYSSTSSRTVRLTVDGVDLPATVLPSTGGMSNFDTAYLGMSYLAHGTHNLRVTFVDGGVDLDWLFAKKASPMITLKNQLTGGYLTAEQGGNNNFSCWRTSAGIWESFSANCPTGGVGTLTTGISSLQSYNGYYVTATGGGGGSVAANQRSAGSNEKFTLVKISGSSGTGIISGDKVALKSSNGSNYLTAISGNSVNVSGTSVGAGQSFTVSVGWQ